MHTHTHTNTICLLLTPSHTHAHNCSPCLSCFLSFWLSCSITHTTLLPQESDLFIERLCVGVGGDMAVLFHPAQTGSQINILSPAGQLVQAGQTASENMSLWFSRLTSHKSLVVIYPALIHAYWRDTILSQLLLVKDDLMLVAYEADCDLYAYVFMLQWWSDLLNMHISNCKALSFICTKAYKTKKSKHMCSCWFLFVSVSDLQDHETKWESIRLQGMRLCPRTKHIDHWIRTNSILCWTTNKNGGY